MNARVLHLNNSSANQYWKLTMRNVDKETIIRFVQFYDYRHLCSELEKNDRKGFTRAFSVFSRSSLGVSSKQHIMLCIHSVYMHSCNPINLRSH